MNAAKWLATGIIGGLVGALVWGAITYFLKIELGWIAWGIGFVVGFCVRAGAGDNDKGVAPGVGAVGIALFSVVLGKYFAAIMLASSMGVEVAVPTLEQYKLVEANGESDPPLYATWQDVPPAKQAEINAEMTKEPERYQNFAKVIKAIGQVSAHDIFIESFGLYDILWFVLAAGTAFRMGSGDAKGNE